jgi:hypothetical protein
MGNKYMIDWLIEEGILQSINQSYIYFPCNNLMLIAHRVAIVLDEKL